mgnify:CR=1 FL=1
MLQPELKLRRDKIRWLMAQQGIDAALTCSIRMAALSADTYTYLLTLPPAYS